MLKRYKHDPKAKLTPKQKRNLTRVARMRDEDIDLSDIPEIPSDAVLTKFYRPRKEPVTVRIDSDVVAWLKSGGPGYQGRINALLRDAMTRARKSV